MFILLCFLYIVLVAVIDVGVVAASFFLQPLLVFLFCCSFPASILFKMFFYLSNKIIHNNVEVIKESYSDPKKHFHENITVD